MVEYQPNYLRDVNEQAPHAGRERLNCQAQTGGRERSVHEGRGRPQGPENHLPALWAQPRHFLPTRHIC